VNRRTTRGRIAFLGMDDLGDYVSDDHLAVAPLAALGWEVESASWRVRARDWSAYAGIVIRTTWDYQDDVAGFLAALERIVEAGAPLANPLEVVRANVHKSYLLELAARGVPVPRTEIAPSLDRATLERFLRDAGPQGAVVKPTVGGGGKDTFRVRDPAGAAASLAALGGREALLQPFLPAMLTRGELSVVYLNGGFSHAVRKLPPPGEFRCQEEHGGLVRTAAADPASLRVAQAALATLGEPPLYARVDLVADGDGPVLMELELVEPSLYLRTDPGAPARFAAAVDRWTRSRSPVSSRP
jgi:glutathione synthase/RimK-type ligase-like ATP-grasp enzyme